MGVWRERNCGERKWSGWADARVWRGGSFRRRWRAAALWLAVLALLGGCGEEAPDEEDGSRQPIVNFRALTLGNMPEGGMDEIYRQLDALTIPELNCTDRKSVV